MVLDSSKAMQQWGWQPTVPVEEILSEIATHAKLHSDWLEIFVVS
jgi:CDP-paratose 2-epimerase